MSTVKFEFDFGNILKDTNTNLEGAVIARAEYSTGTHQYGLQPIELKEGVPAKWKWIDISRLTFVRSVWPTTD